jgi:hypothetical protein
VKYLLLFSLLASCTKTVEFLPVNKTATVPESRYLIKQLGDAVLTISMEPIITCYGFRKGETPKPCNIYIEITCALSKPVPHSIKIELIKINTQNAAKLWQPENANPITLTIVPNTIRAILKSSFTNRDNQTVPDYFRIASVAVYDQVY